MPAGMTTDGRTATGPWTSGTDLRSGDVVVTTAGLTVLTTGGGELGGGLVLPPCGSKDAPRTAATAMLLNTSTPPDRPVAPSP